MSYQCFQSLHLHTVWVKWFMYPPSKILSNPPESNLFTWSVLPRLFDKKLVLARLLESIVLCVYGWWFDCRIAKITIFQQGFTQERMPPRCHLIFSHLHCKGHSYVMLSGSKNFWKISSSQQKTQKVWVPRNPIISLIFLPKQKFLKIFFVNNTLMCSPFENLDQHPCDNCWLLLG